MSYSKRVEQIAGHLNYPKGMLAGQVAIITGSGQGIGAETARLFANEGAKIVVSDIDAGTYPSKPSTAIRCKDRQLIIRRRQGRVSSQANQREWWQRHRSSWRHA